MCFTVERAGWVDLPANQRKELVAFTETPHFIYVVTVLKAFSRAEKRGIVVPIM
jgi:hypothetical protein